MGRPRKYTLDDSCFSVLTEEAAYWIGFLMADGCVRQFGGKKQGILKVTLHEQDYDHLVRLQEFCQTTYPISSYLQKGTNKTVYEFRLTSQQVVSDLEKYGVVPNKSLTAKVLLLEKNSHFWRGVIDGDGWIGQGSRRQLELVGSCELLTQFVTWCKESGKITKDIKVRPHKTIFKVSLSHAALLSILPILYQNDSVSLRRKRLNAEAIMNTPLIRTTKI